jgi:signal peptide peptidase SppA
MNGLPLQAARFFDTLLAIHPGKAATILSALGGRILGAEIEIDGAMIADYFPAVAGKVGDPLGRRLAADKKPVLDVQDGVAIIPVEGTLIHKGGWLGASSGETSYEGLQTRIRAARSDPSVKGVAFEIDSPGGEVSGVFDTATMIRRLSAEKPTIAILTDHALSAGYLLASAARQIVIPETGRAGSIGVMMIHTDRSSALERAGVKVSVLTAGKFKGDGNPFEPLPDDVARRIRADLEHGRQAFARAVAAGRGARLSVEAALATEATDYRGADALALGLVDAVGHSSDAFDDFKKQVAVHAAARSHFSTKGNAMSTTSSAAVAATSISAAEHVNSVETAQKESLASGLKAGRAEGAAAERARIAAILDGEHAKGRDRLARHFAFATELPPDAAAAALQASAVETTDQTAPSPLAAAMAAQRPLALGPGGDRAAVQPKAIDAAAIYARRAAR